MRFRVGPSPAVHNAAFPAAVIALCSALALLQCRQIYILSLLLLVAAAAAVALQIMVFPGFCRLKSLPLLLRYLSVAGILHFSLFFQQFHAFHAATATLKGPLKGFAPAVAAVSYLKTLQLALAAVLSVLLGPGLPGFGLKNAVFWAAGAIAMAQACSGSASFALQCLGIAAAALGSAITAVAADVWVAMEIQSQSSETPQQRSKFLAAALAVKVSAAPLLVLNFMLSICCSIDLHVSFPSLFYCFC